MEAIFCLHFQASFKASSQSKLVGQCFWFKLLTGRISVRVEQHPLLVPDEGNVEQMLKKNLRDVGKETKLLNEKKTKKSK